MQIGVLFFTDPLVINKLERTLGPSNTFTYEKSKAPLYVPNHETLLGLNIASKMDKIPADGKLKVYSTFEDAENAFNAGEIKAANERIKLGGKETSYGREKIERISGITFDKAFPDKEPKDQILDKNTMPKYILLLISNPKRAQILRDLKKFGSEIVGMEGIDLPFNDLFDFNDPELQKILNDKTINEVTRYNELQKYIQDSINSQMKKLAEEGSNYGLAVSSGDFRIKNSQNIELFGPGTLIQDNNGGRVVMGSTTLLTGLTEEEFVKKGLVNREQQQAKKELTPESGYMTRQLTLACSHMIYRKDIPSTHNDPNGYLTLLDYEAQGRTTIDGKVIRNPSGRRVKVKSTIFYDDDIVYADEISDLLKYEDKSDIGISMAMAITESQTQSVMGIKHGGITTNLEKARLFCQEDGVISEISDNFITVNSSGRLIKYPIYVTSDPDYLKNSSIKVGNPIKAGDWMVLSNKTIPLDFNISLFQNLFKVSGTDGKFTIGLEEDSNEVDVRCNLCYAPNSGKLKYEGKYLFVGDTPLKIDTGALYFYPDGYEVKQYDRLCTGVADIGGYLSMGINVGIIFNIFRMQLTFPERMNNEKKVMEHYLESLYGSGSQKDCVFRTGQLNIDMLEVIFKCLRLSSFSARKKNFKQLSDFDSIYFAGVKSGYNDLYQKVASTPDMIVRGRITDSLVLPLILNAKSEESIV